jgi:hypothetical protein
MDDTTHDDGTLNEVSLVEIAGEWHVIVREQGQKPVISTFEFSYYAVNFAEGQRLRLGLDNVTRN